MGCISGFGTKFVARTAGWAILTMMVGGGAVSAQNDVARNSVAPAAPAIIAEESKKAKITVIIDGLRSQKGNVLVCLSTDAKQFPDCSKDKQARQLKVAASAAKMVVFENVVPGRYALALVHDENSNEKMDLRLFLPREGFGMSRNPKIRFGKPKFKNSQFDVKSNDIRHNIKMKYIL